ncbi:MAG: VIT family protein, partial [Proteobacteria bacterium]
VQAAMASAGTFSIGAGLPLAMAALLPMASLPLGVSLASLAFLALLGALGAWAGGAPIARGVMRVAFWGAIAMLVTYAIGSLFGTSVA